MMSILERLFLFDAGNDDWVIPWNPLVGTGDVASRVSAFVGAIRRRSESWGVQIDDTLRSACSALACTSHTPLEIDTLLGNLPFRQSVVAQSTDLYTRQFFERFEALTPDQRQTWRLAVANKLAPFLSNERIRRVLCGAPSMNLRSIVDDPRAILLITLRADKLHDGADVLGELLVHAIWHVAQGRSDIPEDARPDTWLLVDEFQNFGQDVFKQVIAEGRRYHVFATLAHQSLSQLDGDLRSIIRNNAGVRVIYSPGPVDAEELARELAPAPRSEAYAELMTLRTGEAFVVKRGIPAARILTPNSPDPGVTRAEVEALKLAALRHHARRVLDVDREIMERVTSIAATGQNASATKKEVRHVRKPWPTTNS